MDFIVGLFLFATTSSEGQAILRRRRLKRRFGYADPSMLLLSMAALLVWDLRDVHFPSTGEIASRRVIILQIENGRDLLVKGVLQLPPVAVKAMPRDVINAVISIEDRRFNQHGAVDLPSMLRALKENVETGCKAKAEPALRFYTPYDKICRADPPVGRRFPSASRSSIGGEVLRLIKLWLKTPRCARTSSRPRPERRRSASQFVRARRVETLAVHRMR